MRFLAVWAAGDVSWANATKGAIARVAPYANAAPFAHEPARPPCGFQRIPPAIRIANTSRSESGSCTNPCAA
jgi:hypothetical protein